MLGPRVSTGDRQVEGAASSSSTPAYHVETQLPGGRQALLLDIGSVGNLAGDQWVRRQAAKAVAAGGRPQQRKRDRPLTVRGVGRGGERCTHNCCLPVAMLASDGQPTMGTFDTPTVPNSELPALLGLSAARESRMIIDAARNKVYMVGLGDYDLERALPPGTTVFDCVTAPSGHMMLPGAEFGAPAAASSTSNLQQQVAQPVQASGASGSRWAEGGAGLSESRWAEAQSSL